MSDDDLRALERRVAGLERRLRAVAREAVEEHAERIVRAITAAQDRAAHAELVERREHLKAVK